MKSLNRILLGLGCLLLLLISWFTAINTKTTAEKQLELLEQASALLEDRIYIRAMPLLEEAAGYNDIHTLSAETLLKTVYWALIEQSGFRKKYLDLLEKQMAREDASPEMFMEAANYYFEYGKLSEALKIWHEGAEKTGADNLLELYEEHRYAYEIRRAVYENVTSFYNSTIQVQRNGLWGLAGTNGSLLLPCMYDKISTFSVDRAVVQKDNEVFAVDSNNNRIAKLHEDILDFGNYADNRLTVLTDQGWQRANEELNLGRAVFEDLGMSFGGYIAAKSGGCWGIIDANAEWVIEPVYEGLIMDELGRCYARDTLFFNRGELVYLLSKGVELSQAYEDARPFTGGYAAVKKDGKWGFIDESGNEQIGFVFDDALSFGQHLAAVKQGDFWGYIDIRGNIVIVPIFLQAKSFNNGSAPVLTEAGWQFISLLEYKEGASI